MCLLLQNLQNSSLTSKNIKEKQIPLAQRLLLDHVTNFERKTNKCLFFRTKNIKLNGTENIFKW